MMRWGLIADGRIVAVLILGALAVWALRVAIDSWPELRPTPLVIAAVCGLASAGVAVSSSRGRRLARVVAAIGTVLAVLATLAAPMGLLIVVNNPDRQWQWGFGYLLGIAVTGFLWWSLTVSANVVPGSPPWRLLMSAPTVVGVLVAAIALGGDSSRRAAALPEYELAPPDAELLSEGGRPSESGPWGSVSAWAGRTYASDQPPRTVIDFYSRELSARGWRDRGERGTTGDIVWNRWERDGFSIQVLYRCGFDPAPPCEIRDEFELRIYVP